jgi:ATP-binding cassette subfamily F protein 3
MPGIDALITALRQFTGTLIFISHDVYFIRQLSNHVVRVDAGRLTHFPGGYQYYLDKTAAASPQAGAGPGQEAAAAAPPSGKPDRREQKRIEAGQRQARSGERKAQVARVARLESEIQKLETRQKELIAALETPEVWQQPSHAMNLNREWTDNSARLEILAREWEAGASF